MNDRRPTLTRRQHLRVFRDQYPFPDLARLGFRRCVIVDRQFKQRRPDGPWIRVVTLSDRQDRALTLDVDEHGTTHDHITVVVSDDQPAFLAETPAAALQLLATTPGTPTATLLQIPDVTAGPFVVSTTPGPLGGVGAAVEGAERVTRPLQRQTGVVELRPLRQRT